VGFLDNLIADQVVALGGEPDAINSAAESMQIDSKGYFGRWNWRLAIVEVHAKLGRYTSFIDRYLGSKRTIGKQSSSMGSSFVALCRASFFTPGSARGRLTVATYGRQQRPRDDACDDRIGNSLRAKSDMR
jgi:hypothetical protein